MKRLGAVLCLTTLIVMLTASVAFGATTFKLDRTYPQDKQENTTKENMCVKLYFNSAVGNEASEKSNKNTFSIKDTKGNELPTRIMYNPKDATQAMIVVDTTELSKKQQITDNTNYVCTLSGKFIDNNGDELGEDVVIHFKTMNQGRNTRIYMIMMVVMFGGIFFFATRQARKKSKEQNAVPEKEEPFNPYKEAKKTGKPVEEIIAQHEKEMAKKRAKEAKREAQRKADEERRAAEEAAAEAAARTHKVKRRKSAIEAGSTFAAKRKTELEAKAKKASLDKKKK